MHCLSHDRASVMPQHGTKPHCRSIPPIQPSVALAQLLPGTVPAFPAVPKVEHPPAPRSSHSTPERQQSCAKAELAWKGSPCTCRDAAGTQGGQHSLLLTRQADIPETQSTRLCWFLPLIALLCGPQLGWSCQRCRVPSPCAHSSPYPPTGSDSWALQSHRSSLLLRQGGSSILRLQLLPFPSDPAVQAAALASQLPTPQSPACRTHAPES